MESYEPGMSLGRDAAEIYDDIPHGDELAAVAFLGELTGGGPARELAIGNFADVSVQGTYRSVFVPTFLARLRDDRYVDAERVEVDEVWSASDSTSNRHQAAYGG